VETYPAVGASLSRLRNDVREQALAAGAGPRAAPIAQAASEAAANSIVHGYGGGDQREVIEVAVTSGDGGIRVVVADHGSGFRPRRASPGLGLGLALIAQLADELELHERPGGGIELSMRFVEAVS